MKNRTKLEMVGLAIVTGVVLLGSQRVSAQSPSPTTFTQQFNTMVDNIAKKLGLTSDQVKAVFEEAKNVRQTERQDRFEEELTQAVAEGVITETQKQEILAKYKELQEKRESQMEEQQIPTPQELHDRLETERTELEAWAKEKGISMIVLRGLGLGFVGPRGIKMDMRMGHPF